MNGFKKMIMADNQGFFLPKEYIKLDYIESPSVNGYGKCIIETGIFYQNKIIQATIQGNTSQVNAYTVAFGGYQDKIPMTLFAYKDESIGYSLYENSAASGISIDKKVDVTLTVEIDPEDTPSSDGNVKVIGIMQIGDIVKKYQSVNQFADNMLCLFSGGSSDSNSPWNFVGKIFKCKITELDGKVLRYFIPALRISDFVAGMYDMVSGEFFTNSNGNIFEYDYKSIPDNVKPYLSFEALDNDFQLSLSKSDIQYSLDLKDWKDLPAGTMTPAVDIGSKVWVRGDLIPDGTSTGIGTFSCTKKCNLNGRPMFLLKNYKPNDYSDVTFGKYFFANLFKNNTNIVRINNPLTFLADAVSYSTYCYQSMFEGCTNLLNSVYLERTVPSYYAYNRMYYGCTSLVETQDFPENLSTKELGAYTFAGCQSLIVQPKLPDDKIFYAQNMFDGCSNLINAQELLYNGSQRMYANCKNLKKAPNITNPLADGINCSYMYQNCSNLETPPSVLRAASLVSQAYFNTFNNCSKLEKSPIIIVDDNLAKEKALECMFFNCANLNHITYLSLAAPDSAERYMYQWVYGVASSGTIVLNKNIEWDPDAYRGYNGIPANWTVLYCDPENLTDIRGEKW